MIPLYGFVEGDTLGLIVLADDAETLDDVATKLRSAARLRAELEDPIEIVVNDRVIDPASIVAQAELRPLDRIDVRRRGGAGGGK
jgi:hypothetical protein